MAQQLSEAVERATAPYQCALRTRAGCECVAHVLQGITEFHPELTITSMDGIRAFDMVSRESMLGEFLEVDGRGAALPSVRMFHGYLSEYLWEDHEGTVHNIPLGEGCEKGDAMMPLLFAVGQRGALEAIHRRMNPRERLMAFHDDVYMATTACTCWADARCGARRTPCARFHPGSSRQDQGVEPIWSLSCWLQLTGADRPRHPPRSRGVDRFHDPNCRTRHWSVGNADRTSRFRRRSVRREHEVLLDRIPSISDFQCAWLLLVHCAPARACYYLRTFRPCTVEEFARADDAGMWQCIRIVQLDLHKCSAHWASRANCLPMIHARHRRCGGVVGTT